MFNSIWCEEVKVPTTFKEGTRLVYSYINGKNEEGYTFEIGRASCRERV